MAMLCPNRSSIMRFRHSYKKRVSIIVGEIVPGEAVDAVAE